MIYKKKPSNFEGFFIARQFLQFSLDRNQFVAYRVSGKGRYLVQ
jgi:hypothetical protein